MVDKTHADERKAKARAKAALAAERRQKAVTMRREGYSFQRIAEALGISRQAVHTAWKKSMQAAADATKEEAQLYIAEELERIDESIVAMRGPAKNGSHLHSAELRNLYKRRAELLGYNPPTKVAPTDPTGQEPYSQPERAMTAEERRKRIAELQEQLSNGAAGSER